MALRDYLPHLAGKRHAHLLQSREAGPHRTFQPNGTSNNYGSTPETIQCERCRRMILAIHFEIHTQNHILRERGSATAAELAETEADQHDVSLSHRDGIHFGVVEEGDEAQYICVNIKSTGGRVALETFRTSSLADDESSEQRFSLQLMGTSRWIPRERQRTLLVHLIPSYAGRCEDRIELTFFDIARRQRFVITRAVTATVGLRADHEALRASGPYVKKKRTYVPYEGELNFELRPPDRTPAKWKQWLPEYKVPSHISEIVAGRDRKAIPAIKRLMPTTFNIKTHAKFFDVLLYVEEEEAKINLDTYALFDQPLEPAHPRYNLKVPGLEEGRPSILVGDFVLVKQSGGQDEKWYQGCVHFVYASHIGIRFGNDFSTYRGNKFDVRFVLNRISLRRMHFALHTKNDQARILFPTDVHIKTTRKMTPLQMQNVTPINRLIGEDSEQLETVTAILNRKAGDVPFVVFGPPGTGKTVTIVEAMRQILERDPNARILACTPSNSAADLIATRLESLGPSQVFRLNSQARKFKDLPKLLKNFSLYNENEVFVMPTLEQLQKYRVVVSTCISGGVPSGLGLARGYFSHIFIDEAGQATEPEIMIPIKTMADHNTNIVLAGDQKQLGPVIQSPYARQLGLGKSYLSRLMELPIYQVDDGQAAAGGRGVTVVKLVKNFRSHPDILRFSNEHFYANELQASGNPILIRRMENWETLPKRSFPIIFHSIKGKDQQDSSSPSFFNIEEASEVKKYCSSLLENRKLRLTADMIFVITPYHAQKMKILQLLGRDTRTRGIEVGSVEEFQGQERPVVIMSCVRSNEEYLMADVRKSLGFVASPQRLNVAITRAQALLIVVGNPNVLRLDPLWRSFLAFVQRSGGWRGQKPKWDLTEDDSDGESYAMSVRSEHIRGQEEMLVRLRAMIHNKNEGMEVVFEEDSDYGDDDIAVFRRENE